MRSLVLLFLFAVASLSSRGEEFSKLEAGVVVHLGTTDGAMEVDLAREKRVIVHGLSLDLKALAGARTAVIKAGLEGFVTLDLLGGQGRLPYADNLLNLLVADLDTLGARAPSREEILRVMAPGGKARLRSGGEWEVISKARPAGIDEWTHFDYDATGNAVSKDKLVKPPTQVQWISGIQPMPLGGNPAGFSGSSGVRLSDGRLYSDWVTGGKEGQRFGAWDAFNGMPVWARMDKLKGRRLYYHTVAADGRVFQFSEPDGPLVAYDGRTGELWKEYPEAGPMPGNASLAYVRSIDGRLLVSNRSKLVLLDVESGQAVWSFRDPSESLLFFPVADIAAGRAYVVVSEEKDDARIEHRWPNAAARSVVCLDLASGKEIWRCAEVAGRNVGQILPQGEFVALFAGGGIGAGRDPFYANLRASDGEMLWFGTFKPDWNRAGYSALWRDGALYYADPWKIFRLDPATGEESHVFGSDYNARCMRLCATEDYFFHGFLAYVGKDFTAELQSVARSACANSAFPANGMLYFTPNTCRCFTMLRGHLCLTSEALLDPLPDGERLEGATLAGAMDRVTNEGTEDDNLLVEHWIAGSGIPGGVTGEVVPEVSADYSISPDGQRLSALDREGSIRWTFTGAARLGPPLIAGEIWFVACRDGSLHALDAKNGNQRWRFLAAPYRRMIAVHGQLESAWPVYNAVLHDGAVCVAAGRHPEIGGGISLWGLDPQSGAIRWKRVLRKSPAILDGTERATARIVPRSCLNGILESDGTRLSLPGYRDEPFYFDPKLDDTLLAKMLNSPPPKRK